MTAGAGASRLWVFDFDGTLSPIVADRTEARLHPASAAILGELVADPVNRVAVLSTRALEDLVARVPVPGVIAGGSSGLEWRLPDGSRLVPGETTRRKLDASRTRVFPLLRRLGANPGVEIEDKRWSVAVHYRGVLPETMPALVPLFDELDRRPGIRVCAGPMAAEVQFLPSVDKRFGLRLLCRRLDFDVGRGRLFYAGDDENDAAAMRWVLSHKGTVFAVGGRLRIRGALVVDGPSGLARAVRAQTGPSRSARHGGEKEETSG